MKNLVKYFLFFSLFAGSSTAAFCQPQEIARLKKDLDQTTNDSVKIANCSELCYQYTGLKYDSALYFGNKGLELARQVNSAYGIRRCLTDRGSLFFQAGKYPESIRDFLEALQIAERNNDEQGIVNMLNNLAVVYQALKDYDKSLSYYRKALAFSEKKRDNFNISMRLANIGVLYKDKGDLDLACRTLESALHFAYLSKDSSNIARALNNLAEVYGLQNQKQKSKQVYLQAYRIQHALNNARGIFITSSNVASTYSELQQYDSALYFARISLETAKTFNAPNYYKTIYEILAAIYQNRKDYKTALEYYRLFESYKDSIFNTENSRTISDLKTQYEVDKKTAELNAKAAAEKEKSEAIRQEEERRSNIVVAFISGILLLVCVFSFFLYQRFKLTKKQNRIIELQKIKVEEKNREITDSINYAKRLQEAILPPMSHWYKQFPESFIYYRPKDIVAGDFYFLERLDNQLIFAAADCTGHGVPGAMVSLVCSNALTRTVKEFRITEAGKILDKVTELVQETFAKSESEVKDGMDISLCVLDLGTLQLSWAGANNPLWYLKKGESEICELKPDKQPVGKSDHGKAFHTHVINLQRGDLIYLFTDGLADQFGGINGKKYKLKKLRELLRDHLNQSMQQQCEMIRNSFEHWKGELEQIDDLCVIGIRI